MKPKRKVNCLELMALGFFHCAVWFMPSKTLGGGLSWLSAIPLIKSNSKYGFGWWGGGVGEGQEEGHLTRPAEPVTVPRTHLTTFQSPSHKGFPTDTPAPPSAQIAADWQLMTPRLGRKLAKFFKCAQSDSLCGHTHAKQKTHPLLDVWKSFNSSRRRLH